MDAPIDTRNPIGKMDFDTEDRNLPAQHYRYGKNGRSGTSDKDGDGAVENIRGNVLRNESYQNRGFVIGSCPDVKNNAVIYFVCGVRLEITYDAAAPFPAVGAIIITDPSITIEIGDIIEIVQGANVVKGRVNATLGYAYFFAYISGAINADAITSLTLITDNYIERYYDSTGVFEDLTNPVLMGLVLNFSATARIYNPRVIESTFGQLLAWTDGYNEPRLMNIDYMKEGGQYYNVANSETYISLAKSPPTVTPTVAFLTSATPPISYFTKYFYQFRYRYLYVDGSISSMSDMSDVALPDSNFLLSQNYAIRVGVNSGSKPVETVQILVREGNGLSSGDTNPEWYIFKTINKQEESWSDNTIYNVDFYNNEAKEAVSRVNSDVNFYGVPQLAGALEVLNNSQIVLGDITEGYDNVPSTATIVTTKIFQAQTSFGSLVSPGVTEMILHNFFGENYVFSQAVYANCFFNPNTFNRVLGPINMTSYVTFYISFVSALNTIPGVVATVNTTDPNNVIVQLNEDFSQVDFMYGVNSNSPLVFRGLKSSSVVTIGVAYFDNYLRSTGVNIIDDYEVPTGIDFYNDSGERVFYVPRITVQNTSTIPTNFSKYNYVVSEGNIGTFFQTLYAIVGDKIRIVYPWSFSVGDRVRWTQLFFNGVTNVVRVYDYKILSYDVATNELDLGSANPVPALGANQLTGVVEMYTPIANEVLFFETSKLVSTTDLTPIEITGNSYYTNFATLVGIPGPTLAYRFSIQNQPQGLAYSGGGTLIAENRPIIPTFDNFWWKGRVNIETPNQKRLRIGILLRWSGVLINNTQVNNLNVFDSGNYNNELNARFGDISGMRQIGYTLKILQWANINSAFLGRKQIQNADGSTQLVVTDSLIGTINPSEMEYGTKYPGSIISTGRRIYFFDSIKSRMLVDDGNGVNEIALYGGADGAASSTMSKYFRAKSSEINADSDFQIITGFDYLYRDMYLTFVNYVENTQETLYYNEDQNAWKYFMDMESRNADNEILNVIDCYGNVGQSFFGFLQANTYQFNKLSDGGASKYSTLFKVNDTDPLKPLVVETIGMLDADKVKVFLSHSIHANKPIELVEITIPANTMYPNGMYTVLKPGNFDYREGVFYAQIKNDMYTNGIPSTDAQRKQAIVNGRKMRGHVCLVRITYLTDDYVKLYSTGISMIPSEMS